MRQDPAFYPRADKDFRLHGFVRRPAWGRLVMNMVDLVHLARAPPRLLKAAVRLGGATDVILTS